MFVQLYVYPFIGKRIIIFLKWEDQRNVHVGTQTSTPTFI